MRRPLKPTASHRNSNNSSRDPNCGLLGGRSNREGPRQWVAEAMDQAIGTSPNLGVKGKASHLSLTQYPQGLIFEISDLRGVCNPKLVSGHV